MNTWKEEWDQIERSGKYNAWVKNKKSPHSEWAPMGFPMPINLIDDFLKHILSHTPFIDSLKQLKHANEKEKIFIDKNPSLEHWEYKETTKEYFKNINRIQFQQFFSLFSFKHDSLINSGCEVVLVDILIEIVCGNFNPDIGGFKKCLIHKYPSAIGTRFLIDM